MALPLLLVSRYRPQRHVPCSFRVSTLRHHLPVSPHQSSHLCPFFISESSRSPYPFLPDRPLFDYSKLLELLAFAIDLGSTTYSTKVMKPTPLMLPFSALHSSRCIPGIIVLRMGFSYCQVCQSCQLPVPPPAPPNQINSHNLLSGNKTALFTIP
ncbi:hypothetical protein MA16_Dca006315 [Dendrobium catenatum]|uniref:Uncharacterized protein n=1 Tax=Dendrobium catenatum TaxID=906689 RepID=A0A2I0W9H3_9ASPA|nr:hypothetical protein MA16_Dca006315 [Dendrobium catenatum]